MPERFLQGKPLAVFVAPEERRAFRAELMRRLAETSRVEEMQVHLQPRDGAAFPAALTVGVTTEHGAPCGLRWLLRDVSQRAAEPALRTRVEELTDADGRKDEFLALAAHELRNPLAPLSVALQVLRRGGVDDPALDTAEHQVQKLSRLVEELLDVSRIRKGKTELRPERVALDAVAAAAVETVRPLIDERRHALEVALPAPPVVLDADPGRLEQVLTNLLTNAAKYTEPGGRITLRGEREEGHVVIRVCDTGVGLDADLLPRLFEPFVQSGSNGRRSRGGLGLGLSLVKQFVELHGGRVEARSDGPGLGSEFVVRLPAAPPVADGAAESARRRPHRGGQPGRRGQPGPPGPAVGVPGGPHVRRGVRARRGVGEPAGRGADRPGHAGHGRLRSAAPAARRPGPGAAGLGGDGIRRRGRPGPHSRGGLFAPPGQAGEPEGAASAAGAGAGGALTPRRSPREDASC